MTPFATAAEPTAENPRAKSGGNRPPLADFFKETNDTLPGYLSEDNADIVARVAELTAAMARAPTAVTNDDLAGKVSDFIAQVTKCTKQAEAKRVDAKSGPLTAGRLIDGFFQKEVLAKLDTIKRPLLERLTAYQRIKADEERRRREEAERVARDEAQRLAREAEAAAAKLDSETDLARAIEAEDAAEQSRAAAAKALEDAQAKAAELTVARGDYGSSASLRTTWKARSDNWDAVDLNELRALIGADVIQKAANAHARMYKNTKPVAGIVFFEEQTAVVRG